MTSLLNIPIVNYKGRLPNPIPAYIGAGLNSGLNTLGGSSLSFDIDFADYDNGATPISQLGIKFNFTANQGTLMPGGIAGIILDNSSRGTFAPNANLRLIADFPDTGYDVLAPYQTQVHAPVFTKQFDMILFCDGGVPRLNMYPPRRFILTNIRLVPWQSASFGT